MAEMTARMRRIAADWEQVRKDFAGHKNIVVTPIGTEPPEKYHVTYFVNGIYLLPDGRIETLGRHDVEITLHSDYPRYKPICKILTPIWHPNFRDGQICIGDIWGAGESLTDIIINIGDMIQYKSWNSFSPLSAEAAQWAMENKHLFPVGNTDLHIADYASAKDSVEIDLFGDDGEVIEDEKKAEDTVQPVNQVSAYGIEETMQLSPTSSIPSPVSSAVPISKVNENVNDFDITAEELEGIEFVPTAQRMQSVSSMQMAKGGKVNFKTIFVKGIMWALLGAILGFIISEITDSSTSYSTAAVVAGHSELADYFEDSVLADELYADVYERFDSYCERNYLNPEYDSSWDKWFENIDSKSEAMVDELLDVYDRLDTEYSDVLKRYYYNDEDDLGAAIEKVQRVGTGLWSGVIALFVGMFLGIGEGVYYGSKSNSFKYGALGAGISVVMGFISGDIAQLLYGNWIETTTDEFSMALIRGIGWAIMGVGIGLAVGLIKPTKKRVLFCVLGGMIGAFIGGFLFNYVAYVIPNDTASRGVAIIIMGILIGLGVGLLEQFAKQAWLKVIRGEFEGKEYLVFAGTTSIGNNAKNTIVLFKDKLVAPHHCDIVLEGNKYVVVDQGSPLGTVVNGMKTNRHVLKQGDSIAIGNSVLVFNTR